jgi:6-pyruvoyltetrahydropterin/6-carboxytetrahydropterin synthase
MRTVTKTYGHDCGLSATFRQWRAKSHCRFIHGYALSVELTFVCADNETDENGWVINFGGLKPLKQWLQDTFDHKTLVARDDPKYQHFLSLAAVGLIQLVPVERTGCEAFAELIAKQVAGMLAAGELGDTKARLVSVKVSEHGANSASFITPELDPTNTINDLNTLVDSLKRKLADERDYNSIAR